jgi:hypothetical protein
MRHYKDLSALTTDRRIGAAVREDRIVAIGLLTGKDLKALGPSFGRLWPIDETPCFSQLLQAIDEADREIRRERDALEQSGPV